jgi:iron complex outermembrane recepter protein
MGVAQMRLHYKAVLTGSLLLFWITSAGAAGAAGAGPDSTDAATQPSADNAGELTEITVQARRVEENIQRVPVTITAVTEASIIKQDITDVYTLTLQVPAITMCCAQGNTLVTNLRGVEGVNFYFGDAPFNASGYGVFFDVGNVQVLKGPQGTLFGTASNAGAIVYSPVKPGNELTGYVSSTVGNVGRETVEGAITLPLIDHILSVRLGAIQEHRDGYITLLPTSEKLNDRNWYVGRISVLYTPTDNLENYTIFNHYNSHDLPSDFGPTTAVRPGSPANLFYGATLNNLIAQQIAAGPYNRIGYSNTDLLDEAWQTNVINTTTWKESEALTFKNDLSYQQYWAWSKTDYDGLPLPIFDIGSRYDTKPPPQTSWTEEPSLRGVLFNGHLNYTFGGFYRDSNTASNTSGTSGRSYATVFGGLQYGTQTMDRNKSHAAYTQFTYDFLNGLSLTGGFRESWDWYSQTYATFATANNAPVLPIVAATSLSGERAFRAGSYTMSAQYQFTPDTMVYASDSLGYGAGQLQLNSPPPYNFVSPESLHNFEVGIKSRWDVGSWKVQSDASVYYGHYSNVILTSEVPVQVAPPPAPEALELIAKNAALARIEGMEAAFTVVPNRWVQFSTQFAYSEFTFTSWPSFNDAGQPVNLAGAQQNYNPKWKIVLGTDIHLPTPGTWGDFTVGANYVYQTMVFTFALPPGTDIPGIDTQPAFGNLNLNLGWTDIRQIHGLDAQVYVTNVTQNTTEMGLQGAYQSIGTVGFPTPDPREFGLRLRYSF